MEVDLSYTQTLLERYWAGAGKPFVISVAASELADPALRHECGERMLVLMTRSDAAALAFLRMPLHHRAELILALHTLTRDAGGNFAIPLGNEHYRVTIESRETYTVGQSGTQDIVVSLTAVTRR